MICNKNTTSYSKKYLEGNITTNCGENSKGYVAYTSKCLNCNHSAVCKFKDNYNSFIEKLNRLVNEAIIDSDMPDYGIFKLTIDCKYFEHDTLCINNRDFGITIPGHTINPCNRDIPDCETTGITIGLKDPDQKLMAVDNSDILRKD